MQTWELPNWELRTEGAACWQLRGAKPLRNCTILYLSKHMRCEYYAWEKWRAESRQLATVDNTKVCVCLCVWVAMQYSTEVQKLAKSCTSFHLATQLISVSAALLIELREAATATATVAIEAKVTAATATTSAKCSC